MRSKPNFQTTAAMSNAIDASGKPQNPSQSVQPFYQEMLKAQTFSKLPTSSFFPKNSIHINGQVQIYAFLANGLATGPKTLIENDKHVPKLSLTLSSFSQACNRLLTV